MEDESEELNPHYLPHSLRDKYVLEEVKVDDSTASADIDWEPNYAKYIQRSQCRIAHGGLPKSVPDSWPIALESHLSWTSATIQDESTFIYYLSADDILEIEDALASAQQLSTDLSAISPETFPLPRLREKLRELSMEIHGGRGFVVIRGLNPGKYSNYDNMLMFLGISSHIANKRGRQDRHGNMIVHIIDAKSSLAPKEDRQAIYTNVAQPFHSDVFCEILALHARGVASEGGKNILASSWKVYEELAGTRPDLIHTLAAPDWTFDTFGRYPSCHQRPLLFFHEGRIIFNFSRRSLTGSPSSPRSPGIPPMTEAQAEALDAVHFIAEKHQLAMTMQLGDMRFINNLAILHARDKYHDVEGSERHLVRLWLRDEELAWSVPPELQMAWDRVYADLPDESEKWGLDPDMTSRRVVSAKTSCGHG